MTMTPQQEAPHDQPRNPLHGITLERMLNELVQQFGWEEMARRIRVRCFATDPSIASSLKFLRKTPWAREEVESLYLFMLREQERQRKRDAKVVPRQAQNEGS